MFISEHLFQLGQDDQLSDVIDCYPYLNVFAQGLIDQAILSYCPPRPAGQPEPAHRATDAGVSDSFLNVSIKVV